MECKECIHEEICDIPIITDGRKNASNCCKFKNKSDYAEVKHGYWKDDTFCSVCGHEALVTTWDEEMYDEEADDFPQYLCSIEHIEFNITDYCPFCGAIMDGRSDT